MQWNNPCKSRRLCTGARDAAEAPTNWRNPLEHLVKVLVPLSAKAGGAGAAGAAGSSSVSVGGINQRTVLLGAAGTGKNQRDVSIAPSYSHFSVEQVVQEQPLSF